MSTQIETDERYPIGKFVYNKNNGEGERNKFISQIEAAPLSLKEAVKGLNEQQLNTPYREGGWTIKQVVHHLPDSHLNAYIRFKLALTEENPTVKTYEQEKWAELPDYFETRVEISLNLFENLHNRWSILLRSLNHEAFKKSYIHPDLGMVSLDWVIAQYAWHGKHHIAHITSLRRRKGW
jgi:hypothetical protein